ncbi:MAG: molybdopterin molybdenumtransferase MoeA, partial [Anaerolineae bacterium]
MISVDEALTEILSHVRPLETERVPILDAQGRVLAEEIVSDIDIPPFDNSAMDGYAVRSDDVFAAAPSTPVLLTVIGSVAAGYVSGLRVEPGTTIRIMTGAPLPDGADAIVPYEETSDFDRPKGQRLEEPASEIEVRKAVEADAHVRPAGEDVHKGELV